MVVLKRLYASSVGNPLKNDFTQDIRLIHTTIVIALKHRTWAKLKQTARDNAREIEKYGDVTHVILDSSGLNLQLLGLREGAWDGMHVKCVGKGHIHDTLVFESPDAVGWFTMDKHHVKRL